jgi:hypothetical protein
LDFLGINTQQAGTSWLFQRRPAHPIVFPHLRLIYTLRNPLERAWSAPTMAARYADGELAAAFDSGPGDEAPP